MENTTKRALCLLGSIGTLLILVLMSCQAQATPEPVVSPEAPSTSLAAAFPAADAVAGWTPDGEVEIYDSETIFSLVDGQADFFFVYGFERVAVRRYTNADDVVLDIHIWQLAAPEDAYGLFTASVAGEPAAICPSTGSGRCNEGDTDPGRRLAFWQDRYVAQLYAREEIPDADLRAFAEAVSGALPTGGERPQLVDWLPAGGLVARSAIFFHEELSIQNEVWLGGENPLGLSPDTDGVLARYEIDGATARLLLVEYPGAEAAATALAALEGSKVDGLVVAGAQGSLLGAVFGEADGAKASALLEEALK